MLIQIFKLDRESLPCTYRDSPSTDAYLLLLLLILLLLLLLILLLLLLL